MCLPKDLRGATIQRIVSIIGNLLCLNFGFMFGVTPSHFLLYQSTDTPLNRQATEEEATWVISTFFLSAAFGCLVMGLISEKIGPRITLLLSGLLQIASWFCMHFAFDLLHIYSSRFFGGMAAGAIFTVLPVYISEISQQSNSGGLIISIEQWRTLGIFIGFVLGECLAYKYVAVIALVISSLFTLMFPFSQESPYYYMRQRNHPSLEKSLRWFRGIRRLSDRNQPEYLQELASFKSNMVNSTFPNGDMSRLYILKITLYTFILIVGAQLSGCYIVLAMPNEIKNMTKFSELSIPMINLATAQFLGTTVTAWLWPQFSRKLLLFFTSLLCGTCCLALTGYTLYPYLVTKNFGGSSTCAFVILALHLCFANMGMHSLSMLLPTEILPTKVRVLLTSIMWSISWLLLFALVQYFEPLYKMFGLASLFGLFGIVCFIVAFFAVFFIPETRNKSLEEVQKFMGYASVMESFEAIAPKPDVTKFP